MLNGAVGAVLFSFLIVGSALSVNRDGHEVWRVKAEDVAMLDLVMKLTVELDLQEWAVMNRPNVDVMVRPSKMEEFKDALKILGASYDIVIPDVEKLIKRNARVKRNTLNYNYFNYHQFNTFESIVAELKRIAKMHDDIAKLSIIGRTHENRPVYVLRLTEGIKIKPPVIKNIVLIDAGIHAREWVTVSTAMYIINELLTNKTEENQRLLSFYEFVFMPVLNPDGYSYTWTHDRLWRKNRIPIEESRCVGVDLNRNWNYHWGGAGTSTDPCGEDYLGKSAFSEKETIAAKNWIMAHKDHIVLYINFHAYGQLWMTPYGFGEQELDNKEEMTTFGVAATNAIEGVYGTKYTFGPVWSTIYPASSISVDWVKGFANIRLAYTVELPDKGARGFLVSDEQIRPIGKETWRGVVTLLRNLESKLIQELERK